MSWSSYNMPPGSFTTDLSPEGYTCSRCGQVVGPDEVDPEASEAFRHVCVECAGQGDQPKEEAK